MKKQVIAVMVVAALAAVIWAVFAKPKLTPKQENSTMAIYHLSQDGAAPVDYDNLATLEDNIFYPVDAGQYIRWEVIKDAVEEPHKILPGFDVEVGKDNQGLYHRNPYDSGTRIGVATPQANKDWLSSL